MGMDEQIGEMRAFAAMDAYINQAARLGAGTNAMTFQGANPLTRRTQNYMELISLYRSNWIVQNIVNTIPEDMVSNWYKLQCELPPQDIADYEAYEMEIGLQASMCLGMQWGRLFGGAAGIFIMDGDLEEPLDLETIMPGDFRGLHIVDRWSGISPDNALCSDIRYPRAIGLPEYYTFHDDTSKQTFRVHHTKMVRFEGRNLPLWEKQAENYWGASELEAIYDDLMRRDGIINNIAELTFKARLITREIDNLDQMLSSRSGKELERFYRIMQAQAQALTNQGILLINKDEKVQSHQYTFAGLAEIYENIMMDLAGASHTPVAKLFGRTPGGLNATGDGDRELYDAYLDNQNTAVLLPMLNQVQPLVALSVWGKRPKGAKIVFNPIRRASLNDMAQIAARKTAAIAEGFDHGWYDVATALKELREISAETGMYTDITDEQIRDAEGLMVWDIREKMDPFGGLRPTPDKASLHYDPTTGKASEPMTGALPTGAGQTQEKNPTAPSTMLHKPGDGS
jgi:phage-related protein (TIGR01555 family)